MLQGSRYIHCVCGKGMTCRVHSAELAPSGNGKGLHRGMSLQPMRDQLVNRGVQAGVHRLCKLQHAHRAQQMTALQWSLCTHHHRARDDGSPAHSRGRLGLDSPLSCNAHCMHARGSRYMPSQPPHSSRGGLTT